jgi:cyclic beta-1,2-glucan synthetase
VTASGSSFTWAENSRENRLTPFLNDPVTDPTGEAIFIRDDDSGEVWTATPGPRRRDREDGRWVIRHGAGVTRFAHAVHGLESELTVFVDPDEPVKISSLTLTNRSGRRRRLTLTGYAEWILGPPRPGQRLHVVTELDAETGAVMARNPYNQEFAARVAFAAASRPLASASGDRLEFLGRNGTPERPAALKRAGLSGRFKAGPMRRPQVSVTLAPGASGARCSCSARAAIATTRAGSCAAGTGRKRPTPPSPPCRRAGTRCWEPWRCGRPTIPSSSS